jgi:hypothetical protein
MNVKISHLTIKEWIVSIVVGLILFYGMGMFLDIYMNISAGLEILLPWQLAMSTSVISAINMFADGISEEIFQSQKIMIMVSMILFFMAAPLILIRVLSNGNEERTVGPLNIDWIKVSGISLVLVMIFSACFTLYMNINFVNKMNEQTTQNRQTDHARQEMMEVTLEIASRSQTGDISGFESISTEDISRIQRAEHATYYMTADSDTLLNLYAVIPLEGNSADFENADGSTGFVQLKNLISPGKFGRIVTENR